jgi:tRNA(Ile2) C34 agmatinyltransferase TiaS
MHIIPINMPKCPICRDELIEMDSENFKCSGCHEIIPKEHAKESKIHCCDPLNPCK